VIGFAALVVFFVLLPAVAVGGALGAPVLLSVAGVLCLRPSQLRQAVENRPAWLVLLGAFLTLAAASSFWSEHTAAITQAAKIGVLAVGGVLFAAGARANPRLAAGGAVAAAAVLAVLLSIEALFDLPLNRAAQPGGETGELLRNVSRGSSLLIALVWSAAAALMARGGRTWTRLGLLVLAGAGFVSVQFGQFANSAAFLAGLAAFFSAFIAPRFVIFVTFAGLVIWLLAAPFATPAALALLDPQALPYSWNARVEIWSYVCDRIAEQPWYGHGLDAARAHDPPIPVHPHSASLQIWFETGAIGAVLAACALIAAGRALLGRLGANRPAAAAAAGSLAAIGVIANISFNLWAEWWLATFFIVAGAAGALVPQRR